MRIFPNSGDFILIPTYIGVMKKFNFRAKIPIGHFLAKYKWWSHQPSQDNHSYFTVSAVLLVRSPSCCHLHGYLHGDSRERSRESDLAKAIAMIARIAKATAMIPQVARETAMISRLARAIAMNAATCKSNRNDTRFDRNKVAWKPQGSSVTMLLEPECQCVALIAATVKLGQKLDNQPFKSCFQILKARLILPIMSFSRVGKMTENW